MHRNVYDLSHNFMFVSLLPKHLKKEFLNYLNQEAYETYQYILDIDDEFLIQNNKAKFKILGAFDYYSTIEIEIEKYFNELEKEKFQKLVFFYANDDDRKFINLNGKFNLNTSDYFLFRTAGSINKCGKNVFGMPFIINDHFNGVYRPKHLSMSFCGKPNNNVFKHKIINQLKSLDYSDFIIRKHWADNPIISCGLNPTDSYNVGPSKKSRQEFLDNIERNLYGLCLRGVTNSSYRMYELFMMGRIPVLIDTNFILPFKDQIPYETNTVHVKNFDNIDQQIRNFHDSHTEEELLNIQKQNREIWLKYFRVDGAYKETKKMLLELSK
jgi:hypothetical protein